MSSTDDKTPEKKDGLGAVGIGTSVVGGVAAGLVADKLATDSVIKATLAAPYAEAMKDVTQAFVPNVIFDAGNPLMGSLPAGTTLESATAEHIMSLAEPIFWGAKRASHEAVKGEALAADGPQVLKDLFSQSGDTILGKARQASITTHSATGFQNETNELAAFMEKWRPQAEKIAQASGLPAKTEAAQELLNTILADAQKSHVARIAEKVKEIPRLTRLNPFAEGLHLSGGRKGFVVAVGTATALVGAIALGQAFKWFGSGKEQDTGPAK